MDGGAWKAAVHGVAKSCTRLCDFTSTFHFHALEKEMATHSSVLAWRIPGTGEPGGLPSMGSHRVEHDWSHLAAAAAAAKCSMSYLKKYQFKSFTHFNWVIWGGPYIFWGFPGGSDSKESACNVETRVWSLDWEDCLEKEMATHSSVLQYSCLENSINRGAWWATVHGVAKNRAWLGD